MAPKAAPGSLSSREMELLHNYMRCLKSKPEVDMEKFAAMSGFGGVPSARANIGRLLAKLSSDQETTGSQSPSKGDDGEDAAPETPTTGKKKGAGRKRKGDATEGDAAEETPLKKKSTPAKGKGKGKAATTATKSEDEPSPIKKEVDEVSEDGA